MVQIVRSRGFSRFHASDRDRDEGQRNKNWEAKTTGVVKGLRSPFALVLTGTPLENRLEEL